MKIAVYGIGNFGLAMMSHLESTAKKSGHFISGFDRNKSVRKNLAVNKMHPYLVNDYKISPDIHIHNSSKSLAKDVDVIILAVNSSAIRSVIQNIKRHINKEVVLVNTAKALDIETGRRLSEIIEEEMGDKSYEYAMMAGGTFAAELLAHKTLGINIASVNQKTLRMLVNLFTSDNLFVIPTTDVTGVEYASAFKNVIAILSGVVEGLGLSYGTKTFLISRAAKEVEEFCVKMKGAKSKTFGWGSQCWGNDLLMSCTGKSRNREFGILLGRGMEFDQVCREMSSEKKTIEGVNTIKILDRIMNLKEYPIMNYLFDLTNNRFNPDIAKIIRHSLY